MKTDAWVFVDGDPVVLTRKDFEFQDITEDEVLCEALYGCLEGNIIHAFTKEPENVFLARRERELVMGNAGVVRVIECGANVSSLQSGDICVYFCNGEPDEYGYPQKITGYDKAGSMGVYAKKLKLHEKELLKIPANSKNTLEQWAIFSLKFVTAWANWRVAYNAYRIQMPEVPNEDIQVWAWGGGVSYAELKLAKLMGCLAGMITSKSKVMQLCNENGISVVDRKIRNDSAKAFRKEVMQKTNGKGVSVFIDNIGQETYQDTIRLLARQGVLATNGWKDGAIYPVIRPVECIARHIHVHTHYATYEEGLAAMRFAEENDWIPPYLEKVYGFEELGDLTEKYRDGKLQSDYIVFKIQE